MAWRGPDGEGFHQEGPVGFAHRRLAIIDLATGDQPMFNEDRSVVTIFNGEIFDFQDLIPELASAGHTFKTKSDTEVLVHGWEEWGSALPSKLNGMFAFAIYDRHRRTLFLARDRIGVKPLYWYRSENVFVFASELWALLASGLVPREMDREALELYLHYQYVPSPLTIYRNVRKLEPAQSLELNVGSGEMKVETWWSLPLDHPTEERPLGAWMEELEALAQDAVRIRLISDVPLGAFLSGGTDSAAVVGWMARALQPEPVRTFSIGFADRSGEIVDELPRAAVVARRFTTRHEEFHVDAAGVELLPKLAVHFGEPFADSSAVPTYQVSRVARSRVKVVLSGDGGDEMFAGYHVYSGLVGSIPSGLPLAKQVPGPRRTLTGKLGAAGRRARGYAAALRNALLGRGLPRRRASTTWQDVYDTWATHFTETDRRALLGPAVPLSGAEYVSGRFRHPSADSVIAAAQYCDLKTYLPEDVLVKVDRMSMANSLEVRSPFLDYRIAELAFRMPTSVKVPEAWPDGRMGKYVLKELVARELGREYVYAPKQGFGVPLADWLRRDRTGYVRDSLLGSGSPIGDWLAPDVVRRIVLAHLGGAPGHAAHVWNLLAFDAFLRHVHAAPVPAS